jgi:hypothetical protein
MKKLCISAHTIRNDFFYWPSRYTISLTKYFFLFSLLQLHKKIYKTTARLDLFYPFFLTLQFAFYVGWLKANNSHATLPCLFPSPPFPASPCPQSVSSYTANSFPFNYSQKRFSKFLLLISTKYFQNRIIIFCLDL